MRDSEYMGILACGCYVCDHPAGAFLTCYCEAHRPRTKGDLVDIDRRIIGGNSVSDNNARKRWKDRFERR